MQVKFVDLGRQYQDLRSEILDTVDKVFNSGWYVLGPNLEKFEEKFAEYCGVKHAIGVGNGSDALYLILASLGIGPGDEVITAPNSFVASAAAVDRTGATTVFCDVGEDMNLDPSKLEEALTERTKVVMPVHLTGRIAKMEQISQFVKRHGLLLVEDAAQAVGAKQNEKRAGSFGVAAGFSLHPLKNLFVHGDGGMITTNSSDLASHIREFRNHGLRNRDEAGFWGINSRLDEVQAAVALIKLKHLDHWNARNREIAKAYSKALKDFVRVPEEEAGENGVYHRYMIRTNQREELAEFLLSHEVETKVNYPIPLHLMPASNKLETCSYPMCEQLSKTILSLPIYPTMTDQEVHWVISKVKQFFCK